jgi:hypothetical protein
MITTALGHGEGVVHSFRSRSFLAGLGRGREANDLGRPAIPMFRPRRSVSRQKDPVAERDGPPSGRSGPCSNFPTVPGYPTA